MASTSTGRCVCESLRYKLDAPPLFTHACHCLTCQKITGTAFGLTTIVMRDDLVVTEGAMNPLIRGPRSTVFGCAICATRIYVEYARLPVTYTLKPGTLDDSSIATPQAHIWVKRKHAWITLPVDIPSFDENYDVERTWPAESLARMRATLAPKG